MVWIAHLSDPHIGEAPQHERRTRAAMAWLDSLTIDLGCVLVTGDLTAHGTPDERTLAADALASRHQVITLVGNHDVTRTEDKRPPAAHDIGELRLACLDSTIPSEVPGSVADQCDWLTRTLADGRPTIVALHHPPSPLAHPIDDASLLDASLLWDRLTSNVVGVLHGHAHSASCTHVGDVPVVGAPAIARTFGLAFEPDRGLDPLMVALHHWSPGSALVTHYRTVPGD